MLAFASSWNSKFHKEQTQILLEATKYGFLIYHLEFLPELEHLVTVKSKKSVPAKDWIFLVEQYLGIVMGNQVNEEQAIAFAGSLFNEAAASWWVSYRTQSVNISWEKFKNDFLRQFQDLNESRTARDEITSPARKSKCRKLFCRFSSNYEKTSKTGCRGPDLLL
jgi:hypothetical protein